MSRYVIKPEGVDLWTLDRHEGVDARLLVDGANVIVPYSQWEPGAAARNAGFGLTAFTDFFPLSAKTACAGSSRRKSFRRSEQREPQRRPIEGDE